MTPNEQPPQDDDRDAGAEQPRAEEPQVPTGEQPTREQPAGDAGPRRLVRSRTDRVVGGVASGIAIYFNVDPVIVRVIFVALTFLGGAGLLLYLAALLLVPDDRGQVAADASSFRGKVLIAVAGVLLFIAAASLPWSWGDWFLGGVLFPVAVLALLGLGAWWLVQGRRPAGDAAGVLRAIVLGLLLLAGCLVLAMGAAWATALGGGAVVAALVVAAGVLLVAGAFAARVRWLILPALAISLPLAVVSAAGIEVDGSIGERDYRPASASDIHDTYELGIGSMVVDLRDTDLGPGEHRVKVKLGVGEAVLVVPDDVCVASEAEVGLGAVTVFERDNGGVDVDWDDERRAAPDTPVVVVDAEIGVGRFEVANELPEHYRGWDRSADGDSTGAGFAACDDRA